MVVEVVACEVGEGGGFEVDCGEAVLVEGVGACLDDHKFCAGLEHLGLFLCDGEAIGGGEVASVTARPVS